MAFKMTHPDSAHTIEADSEYVEMYESQGWQLVLRTKPPATKKPPAKPRK